jgi:cbb3-type cytochrome oxidase subunit 3
MFIKKNKKKNILFLISFLNFFIFNFLLISNVIAGEGVNKALSGLTTATNKGFGDNHGLETNISTAIGKVVGAGLAFIGTLFLILIIYGGFVWMFARGNEQEVEKAKSLISQAIIGLIIVLAAYAITSYIGNSLTAKE